MNGTGCDDFPPEEQDVKVTATYELEFCVREKGMPDRRGWGPFDNIQDAIETCLENPDSRVITVRHKTQPDRKPSVPIFTLRGLK